MSSSSLHPPTHISVLCHLAHTHHRPYQLANYAQAYISHHPSSPSAWTYLGLALHALHRHSHAAVNFRIALALARTQAPNNLPTLCLLLRISHFLADLRHARNSPSPTAQLQNGWYRAELEHRLTLGDLVFLRPYAAFRSPDPPPSVTPNTCAIVQDADPECLRHEAPSGCHRYIDPSVIPAFPLAQTTGGHLFLKHRIVSLGCDCYYYDEKVPCDRCEDLPLPLALFPKLPSALPPTVRVLGGPLFAVHVATGLVAPDMHALLGEKLGRLAARRRDSPVKNYENTIDPNIAAVNGHWDPTEFSVELVSIYEALNPLDTASEHYTGQQLPEDVLRHVHTLSGAPKYAKARLRSAIPDLDPQKHAALHLAVQHVLSAALSLLTNLQLPALLLPGPLQVVVKAQRIVLAEGELYAGVWHEDGLREHVAAIVLYYYGISSSLTGGAMEFASQMRIPMYTVCGDGCGPYPYEKDGIRGAIREFTVKASVREGTMLVFSNYAQFIVYCPWWPKAKLGRATFWLFSSSTSKIHCQRQKALIRVNSVFVSERSCFVSGSRYVVILGSTTLMYPAQAMGRTQASRGYDPESLFRWELVTGSRARKKMKLHPSFHV